MFWFSCYGSVDCLDLYTNLIILLNGEVISPASLNSNYNGRLKGKRATSLCFTNTSVFVHTSSSTLMLTLMYTRFESSQHAEIPRVKHNYFWCLFDIDYLPFVSWMNRKWPILVFSVTFSNPGKLQGPVCRDVGCCWLESCYCFAYLTALTVSF